MYGTAFGIDTFDPYRKDIAKRLKQKVLPQVDILIVVNMFLTGFDAKPLNTLYLDKNLVWHSLVQAYSRTERISAGRLCVLFEPMDESDCYFKKSNA